MSSTRRKRLGGSRRQGAVLVAALVCVAVVMSVLLATVRSSLRLRRQMIREIQMEQTRWLVDAGVRKAIAQIQEQPGYQGQVIAIETVPAKYPTATVEIDVRRSDTDSQQARLVVTARIGDSTNRAGLTQRTEEITIEN